MLTYGLSFRLVLNDGIDGTADEKVRTVVAAWYEAKVSAEQLRPEPRRRFSNSQRIITEGSKSVWEFAVVQDSSDGGSWNTEVRSAFDTDDPRAASITVVMRRDADPTRLAPVRFYAETPAFIRTLGESCSIQVGTSTATSSVRRYATVAEADQLIQDLASPERSLPLVVVTESARGGFPIADLSIRLARFLFGLATVVEVGKDATFRLTERVGKDMSVFDGGLRVYWPGWTSRDTLRQHPLLLRRRIEFSAAQDKQNPDRLVRGPLMAALSRAAASRFAYPEAMMSMLSGDLRRKLEAELSASTNAELVERINKLSEEAAQSRLMEETALADNTRLNEELAERTAELSAARKELERLRAELAGDQSAENVEEDSPWGILDPHEGIERARSEFADTLIIPDGLKVDTKESGAFWYHALQCLHRLCEADRRGEATNKRELLRDLLHRASMPPKDTYKQADTGVWVKDPATNASTHCRERVHLKEGQPSETESVYWFTKGDRASHRYVIGRIGRHA